MEGNYVWITKHRGVKLVEKPPGLEVQSIKLGMATHLALTHNGRNRGSAGINETAPSTTRWRRRRRRRGTRGTRRGMFKINTCSTADNRGRRGGRGLWV